MGASNRVAVCSSLAILWLGLVLPVESLAVCTGTLANGLCGQQALDCNLTPQLCTDLEPMNVSLSYDSGTDEYSYSLEVCNTDGLICAESNQVSQVKLTLTSFEDCPDILHLIQIDTDAHPIDVGTCLDSTDIPELAGTLTTQCLQSDSFCNALIEVDSNDAFCEDSETNNNVGAVISTDVPPDLRFLDGVECTEGGSALCDDSNPNTTDVRFQFTIENHSCGPADVSSAVYERILFNSQDSCGPVSGTSAIPSSPIGPAETRDFDICHSANSSCAFKCCKVILDEDNTVGEDASTTDNNTANDNIISAKLFIDSMPHGIDTKVLNSANVPAELTSVVATPLPSNWDSLSVTPSTGMIAADAEATITLTYQAGPGAVGKEITVVTTNSVTGWTQTNIFVIGTPIPIMPVWGFAAIAAGLLGAGALGWRWRVKQHRS